MHWKLQGLSSGFLCGVTWLGHFIGDLQLPVSPRHFPWADVPRVDAPLFRRGRSRCHMRNRLHERGVQRAPFTCKLPHPFPAQHLPTAIPDFSGELVKMLMTVWTPPRDSGYCIWGWPFTTSWGDSGGSHGWAPQSDWPEVASILPEWAALSPPCSHDHSSASCRTCHLHIDSFWALGLG